MEPLKLWDKTPDFDPALGQKEPTLTPFLLNDGKVHGCVIVCPGGGYNHKAAHESAPVAERLNALGFHAFVLDYRVAPYRHPVPLRDAQRAIRFVRYHAKEYGIPEDKIAILGFSAGGHLICSTAVLWDNGDPDAKDPIDRVSCRPDAFIPCYAVVSLGLYRHPGTAECLLGEHSLASARLLSCDTLVNGDTPPAFIWHTAQDQAVPVENSLNLAKALLAWNIPVSLHIFPYGEHGVGLGRDTSPLAEDWPELLRDFLDSLGF